MKIGNIISIIGGFGLIICTFLPWTTYDWPTDIFTGNNGVITVVRHYGYEMLGLYTGVIGVIIIILGILCLLNKNINIYSIIIILLSIVSVMLLLMTELGKKISVEFGFGFELSYLATIISLFGGIIMKNQYNEENKVK
jgi:hypothetical protein